MNLLGKIGNAALSGQRITLGGSDLDITEALTIDATALAANVTIDANLQSRIFNIDDPTITTENFNVTLAGLTLTGGRTIGDNDRGGGIRFISSGTLTLTSSTVSGNRTMGSGPSGGGIFTSTGDVTLTSSTVSGNSTTGNIANGGGIFTFSGAVTLTSSTVSGNSSSGFGGGIYTNSGAVTLTSSTVSGNSSGVSGGGILTTSGAVTLTSSTVSGNSAAGLGGGFYAFSSFRKPALTIENSIVAGNTDRGTTIFTAADLRPDFDSIVTINSSLIGVADGLSITGNEGNQTGTAASPLDPLLGPLANNGGPTETHALLADSPAFDRGDPGFDVGAIPNDQRGAPFARGVGLRVDIGAYERQTVPGLNLTVDTSVDENDGDYSAGNLSLREAVGLASGSIGADTISFDAALSGETITLGGTELEITEALTIDATALAANVTINANNASRIFNITATSGNFTLAGLTLTGGKTTGNNASGQTTFSGGAIRSLTSGNLTLDQSTVSGNSTAGNFAEGGGIYSNGAVTLTSSTVTDNHASDSNATGGGIWNNNDTITVTNSIVAGNTASGGSPDIRPGTGIFSVDFSLLGTAVTPDAGGSGNIFNNNPQLGPLANNGGQTETHAPLVGSPAIDAGDLSFTAPPNFDQRGAPFARVVGGRIDIGAIETGNSVPSLEGDYDNDGFVGQADLDLVLLNWGKTSPPVPAGWVNQVPAGLIGQAALDGVLLNWGDGTSPIATLKSGQSAVGSRQKVSANLIDAVMAVELFRSRPVADAPTFDDEPAFAEALADRIFATESIAPAKVFADESEQPDRSSSEIGASETPWLPNSQQWRVFG